MLKKKIYDLIKGNPKLYVLAKAIKNRNNPELYRLLRGYYEYNTDSITLMMEHLGEAFPNRVIYRIHVAPVQGAGFFAMIRFTLEQIYFAEQLGFTPVVDWGKNSRPYHDKEMDAKTENVFEYYFEAISDISCRQAEEGKNVINDRFLYQTWFLKHAGGNFSYLINEEELSCLSEIYRKYIRLNKETRAFMKNELSKIFVGRKTLGIHIRGTDFAIGLSDHPIMIMPEKYLGKAREIFDSGNYEQLFLATDDLNALQLFTSEFKEKLIYYKDTVRTDNDTGAHETIIDRPLHHYRLGLEVLRDVYTLAYCDGLIAGLSQVSFAARYISLSFNRRYENIAILSNGINSEGG